MTEITIHATSDDESLQSVSDMIVDFFEHRRLTLWPGKYVLTHAGARVEINIVEKEAL